MSRGPTKNLPPCYGCGMPGRPVLSIWDRLAEFGWLLLRAWSA